MGKTVKAAADADATVRVPSHLGGVLTDAAEQYSAVRDAIQRAIGLHPERKKYDRDERLRSPEAAETIRQAGQAEQRALERLKRIVASV